MVYMDHVVGNHEQRAQMIDVWMAVLTQHRQELVSLVYDVPIVRLSVEDWPVMPRLNYFRTSRVNFLEPLAYPSSGARIRKAPALQVFEARVDEDAMIEFFRRQTGLRRVALTGEPEDLLDILANENGYGLLSDRSASFRTLDRVVLRTVVSDDFGDPARPDGVSAEEFFRLLVSDARYTFNERRQANGVHVLLVVQVIFMDAVDMAVGRHEPSIFDRYNPLGPSFADSEQ